VRATRRPSKRRQPADDSQVLCEKFVLSHLRRTSLPGRRSIRTLRGLRMHNHTWMHVSARADYAVRALVELAAGYARPLTCGHLAASQHIPLEFLGNILQQLKTAGPVSTHLGSEGGYGLARPANHITLADVIRAVDGPLAYVRGEPPETVLYAGTAEPLRDVSIAVRASLRSVLEHVTLADVAHNDLPAVVKGLAADPLAWGRTAPEHSPPYRSSAPAAARPPCHRCLSVTTKRHVERHAKVEKRHAEAEKRHGNITKSG
jgi:Rrf2 family protein